MVITLTALLAIAPAAAMAPLQNRYRTRSWEGFRVRDDDSYNSAKCLRQRRRCHSLPGPGDAEYGQQVNPRDLIEFYKEQEWSQGRLCLLPKRLLELHADPFDKDYYFPINLANTNNKNIIDPYIRSLKSYPRQVSNGNVSRGSLPSVDKAEPNLRSSTLRLLAGRLHCPSISSIVEAARHKRHHQGKHIRSFSVADTLSTLRAARLASTQYLPKSLDAKFTVDINGGFNIRRTSQSSSLKLSLLDDAFCSGNIEPTKQSLISSMNTVRTARSCISLLHFFLLPS